MSARYVCVHAHFYQPPREIPLLGKVPLQPSAGPDHVDWNERVFDECYRANLETVLLRENKPLALANNYERLSFNIGPTLLSWMEREHPREYQLLRKSAGKRAVAQAHGHLILPLCNARDRTTQVQYGIDDYIARFGDKPRGMWLPETAVSHDSLYELASAGIEYTILAPNQCARSKMPDGDWHEGLVDSRIGYRVRLADDKSIVVFFYNGEIAHDLAFGNLLTSGQALAERFLQAFDARETAQLVHVALDGETFGHHHKFGDHALAFALRVLEREGVKVCTYADWLDDSMALGEAVVVEDSSWSCAHGIERWRSDCGCRTGAAPGQEWRAPFRAALDVLRDLEIERFSSAKVFVCDPWAARDAYGSVVSGLVSIAEFSQQYVKPGLEEEARKLLEAQFNAMSMYTSCAWFFGDLQGLEPMQSLRYACELLHSAPEHEQRFRSALAHVASNGVRGDELFDAVQVERHAYLHVPGESTLSAHEIRSRVVQHLVQNVADELENAKTSSMRALELHAAVTSRVARTIVENVIVFAEGRGYPHELAIRFQRLRVRFFGHCEPEVSWWIFAHSSRARMQSDGAGAEFFAELGAPWSAQM